MADQFLTLISTTVIMDKESIQEDTNMSAAHALKIYHKDTFVYSKYIGKAVCIVSTYYKILQ